MCRPIARDCSGDDRNQISPHTTGWMNRCERRLGFRPSLSLSFFDCHSESGHTDHGKDQHHQEGENNPHPDEHQVNTSQQEICNGHRVEL